MEPSIYKRLCHIMQAVYYMLRKGLNKKKVMMDLQFLMNRSKLAGKTLTHLLTLHPHSSGKSASAFSCLSVDPNLSFYNPNNKDVEFSCSNTPYTYNFPSFHLPKRDRKSHKRQEKQDQELYEFDAATIARAFEIMNNAETADMAGVMPTPSPMLPWSFGKSPAVVRQLRVTDSPFPIQEEDGATDGFVDRQAEEFIKKFYEQLRLQSVAATPTPDNTGVRRGRRG